MIERVEFASCYVYSPCGTCETSERSRILRALLKSGNTRMMAKYAARVREQASERGRLAGFFDATDILVPVPGCEPTTPGSTSVTDTLAAALLREGIGYAAWGGLRRVRAVRKSATAPPRERPAVGSHYDTLAVVCMGEFSRSPRLVLIDDVITTGRTLLAAAMRLHGAFPLARLRAFALLRTMGLVADVERLLDPCVGEIRWRAGDARRCP
ncbi:MAG TPA: hypothetical protein VK437_12370 [Steroidobacteraceae bacterium]|nr:hypothetical protein [Steroidobacteraceae bacterium]